MVLVLLQVLKLSQVLQKNHGMIISSMFETLKLLHLTEIKSTDHKAEAMEF